MIRVNYIDENNCYFQRVCQLDRQVERIRGFDPNNEGALQLFQRLVEELEEAKQEAARQHSLLNSHTELNRELFGLNTLTHPLIGSLRTRINIRIAAAPEWERGQIFAMATKEFHRQQHLLHDILKLSLQIN